MWEVKVLDGTGAYIYRIDGYTLLDVYNNLQIYGVMPSNIVSVIRLYEPRN